jgi:predicted dehydrogenase
MSAFSRRSFLKSAAVIAAGSALPPWFSKELESLAATPRPLSPNDKPNIALIGCGGRGRGIGKEAANYGNMTAICDVDESHLDQAAKLFPAATRFKDFRKVLARGDIHVVINGTPDHWHTLVNLGAVKNGKDVYSEKPLTLTIDEGKRLVRAVAKHKRILQTGSQQRSDARFRLACELVRNGRIGRVKHVETILPSGRHGGPFAASAVPAGLDWEFWLGQTPKVDYVKERCHGNFRYWFEYSSGTLTDWGAHHNDIALWGLGLERSGPVEIEGRFLIQPIPGGFSFPSEFRVQYQYANGITHTCESTSSDNPSGGVVQPAGKHHGVRFEGTDGWIFVTRGKIEASRAEILNEPLPSNAERLYVSSNHMANFFDCIRSRKPPVCDAEIGHRSVSLCHLGTIACQLGRKLRWNPEREQFIGDKEAQKLVAREMRKPWNYNAV